MIEDEFEIVDRDYDQCSRKNAPRQIKTRKSSFSSILERFRNYRISRLESKLDKMKDKALTMGYEDDRKLSKNAESIAKLEEKIMVLSKEEVPTNYVHRRAIKLKNRMIDNLTWKTGRLYSVGLDKKDEIFAAEEPPVDDIAQEVGAYVSQIMDEEAATKEENLVAETDVADAINSELDNMGENIPEGVEIPQEEIPEVQTPNDQEVRDVINDSFENVENEQVTTIPEATAGEEIDVENVVDKNDVRDAVNSAFDETPEDNNAIDDEVPTFEEDDVQYFAPALAEVPVNETPVETPEGQEVEQGVTEQPMTDEDDLTDEEIRQVIRDTIHQIKVSRNNSNPVNFEKFDENGNERPKRNPNLNYTPMTDEEIRESQEKLGWDENGHVIDNREPVEQVGTARVVEAPEEIAEQEVSTETEVNEEPIASTGSTASRIEDYNALKEKILFLQQQQAITKEKKAAALRREQEAAARAEEARKAYEASQKSYADKIEMLRAYTEALQADCDSNVQSAEDAVKRTTESEEFIASQEEKVAATNQIIDEIDSLIGNESDSVKTR